MHNKKIDRLAALEEIHSHIYLIFAVVMLALNTVLCAFTPLDPAIVGIVIILVYTLAALVVYFFMRRKLKIYRLEADASEAQSQSVIYAFKNQIKLPYAVITEQGKIITANSAFANALDIEGALFNLDINSLCSINSAELIELSNKKLAFVDDNDTDLYEETPLKNVRVAEIANFNDRKFRMECHPISSEGKTFYMIFFYDISELSAVSTELRNQHTAIGYIAIDNLEEIAQYVKVSYQEETRRVGKLLGEWASSMGGVLREYENNKFLIIFNQHMLSECVKNKFAFLSEIHKIEIGDAHIPLTVSMGVATTGATLEEREHDAMVSLDMALQRGGDQVVLKNPTGIFYFGAKTKTQQKRTRGHGKIIYAKLANLIENSSNILIMGHKSPDFDCIGACIGMCTLIKNMYKSMDVKIVTDTECDNFRACTSRLLALADYKSIFIDAANALEYNSSQTLLIIVDANNMAILESPDLAKSSFKKVIIDHHIKKEEFEEEPELAYIDPSASSTCELIAEILEDILPPDISFKEEANIMMSGIMLDTKNFTRTVGMRTFAAALYLKNCGADPEYARTFFEESFEEYLSAAQFGSAARIHRGCVAIAGSTATPGTNYRVLAAKTSDKLLAIKNVAAAFTMISVDGNVQISARSDGSINVQLIAETLGGGGHFDMAGAMLKECSLEDAENRIIEAIDKYFDNVSEEEDESKN